jgi:hypothetical protein
LLTAKQETAKENITFRLDKETLDKLRFEADEKKTSVNAIASAIFATHYKWTATAAKAGMIPIHKTLLAMFVDRLRNDEIAESAKLFAEVKVKDMILILRNDFNLLTFLDVLETWMTLSSLSFTKNMSSNTYSYIISHEVGGKWSAFLSLMLQSVFKNMGVNDVSFEVTDGTVLFSIPKLVLRAR